MVSARLARLSIALSLLLPITSSFAQLDPTVLQKVKDATVLIEVTLEGKRIGTGTGFFIAKIPGTDFIATNAHVIEELLASPEAGRATAILHPGLPNESQVQCELAAVSLVDDLALLQCFPQDDADVLALAPDDQVLETQRVFVAGFPFGDALATGGRRPNVTITATTLTSVRAGKLQGYPEVLQTSGGIDPGNSGGPVISSEGKVVGISVAKVENSAIGFAIPVWKLAELQPVSLHDIMLQEENGSIMAGVGLTAFPSPRLTSVPHLLAARIQSAEKLVIAKEGRNWARIAGTKVIAMAVTGNSPIPIRHKVAIDISRIPGSGDVFVFQWTINAPKDEAPNAPLVDIYSRPLIVARQQIDDLLNGKTIGNDGNIGPQRGSLGEQIALKMGGRITRVTPAGAGRYLAVRSQDDLITLVDIETSQKVAQVTDVNSETFVAGKSALVTFNRNERTYTQYPLPDLAPAITRSVGNKAVINNAAWGSATNGPIAVIAQGSGARVQACMLMDVRSGRLTRLNLAGDQVPTRGPSLMDAIPVSAKFDMRMSNDGETISMWGIDNAPAAVHSMRKSGRRWDYRRLDKGAAYGFVSPTGKLLCTPQAVYAGDHVMLHNVPMTLPTQHDDFFLALGGITKAANSGVLVSSSRETYNWSICSTVDMKIHKVIELPGPLSAAAFDFVRGYRLPPDERYCCLPQRNLMAVVFEGSPEELQLLRWSEPIDGAGAEEEGASSKSQVAQAKPEVADATIDEFRKWFDATGKHSTEAKFVAAKQGYVKLERPDGTSVVMKISSLSTKDQNWIKARTPSSP